MFYMIKHTKWRYVPLVNTQLYFIEGVNETCEYGSFSVSNKLTKTSSDGTFIERDFELGKANEVPHTYYTIRL